MVPLMLIEWGGIRGKMLDDEGTKRRTGERDKTLRLTTNQETTLSPTTSEGSFSNHIIVFNIQYCN
jgi:hypothetical protein